jgi:hypothetical protein
MNRRLTYSDFHQPLAIFDVFDLDDDKTVVERDPLGLPNGHVD